MFRNVLATSSMDGRQATIGHPANSLGEAFLKALAAHDFDGLEKLFKPETRFRAMVPSGERQGNTAAEAAGWFRRWFGNSDTLQILQSTTGPVFDRLYLSYQLRLHDSEDGWRVIEQHAYCIVQDGQIADMWLICSGFRPDLGHSKEGGTAVLQSPRPHLGGDVFYDAGSKGCAEGPIDEIARLLRPLTSGQTLEIYATNPSVAGDLPAWCRLSEHALVRHEGDYFLIQHR